MPSRSEVLPPGVSSEKRDVPGGWAYVFRDQALGEIGRLLVQEVEGGGTHFSLEVVGDPADPATTKRKAILDSFGPALIERVSDALGGQPYPGPVVVPAQPSSERRTIAAKLVPCERCGGAVAMLIFADDASSLGQMEDYARVMYGEYTRLDLPTWIIGPPSDVRLRDSPSDVLQVWPRRTPLRQLGADEFNASLLDPLIKKHCS